MRRSKIDCEGWLENSHCMFPEYHKKTVRALIEINRSNRSCSGYSSAVLLNDNRGLHAGAVVQGVEAVNDLYMIRPLIVRQDLEGRALGGVARRIIGHAHDVNIADLAHTVGDRNASIDIADRNGSALRRVLFSAECFSERAIFPASFQVKTPASRSSALLSPVTLADQFSAFALFLTTSILLLSYFRKYLAYVL